MKGWNIIMKKILGMSSPIIRAYAKHAHIFSILGAQSEEYIPWVYNYYVQLSVPEGYSEFNADYLIPSIFTYAPNLFVSRIERQMAFGIKDGIINFLKYYIDKGYYIYTLLQVDQIDAYKNSALWTHDPLLYGYDDDKEEFYFADTYIDGKYTLGVASYEEIIRAAGTQKNWEEWNATDWVLDVVCMKYKNLNVKFTFNKAMYIELLSDYLEQKDSYHLHWGVQGWEKGKSAKEIFGIGIYSFLQKYLSEVQKEKRGLDQRGFYVILEHKKNMEKTLKYILGEDWKDKYADEESLLHKVIEDATIMLNLCIKYNSTGDEKILNKIHLYVLKLEKNEKILFPRLIDVLYCNKNEVEEIQQ